MAPNSPEYDRTYWKQHSDQFRDALLKSRYGITRAEYEALLEGQSYKCLICGGGPGGNRKRFSVDHDHGCCSGRRSCGKCIRGLLCFNCNANLGYLEKHYDALITYLRK